MPELVRPDGCRLHYELHGPGGATPLILLEGMGGSIAGWRRSLPRLGERHHVIAYDFRGNGRSTMPEAPVTIATFVEDTVALFVFLGAGRAHVYGMSFGGMVAQELALTHPEAVRSLVLAATRAGGGPPVPRDAGSMNVPKSRPWLALYSEGFAAAHPAHVADDLRHGARQQPNARRRQWEAMRSWRSWDRLPALRVPTLVLHGTQDRLVPSALGRQLADRIPKAELVLLEGAGHLYHSEQPEAADRAVLDFLDGVDARERAAE